MAQTPERKMWKRQHVMSEFSQYFRYGQSLQRTNFQMELYFFRQVLRNAKSFNHNAKIILPQF
jgi:hypothetical protein